MPTPARQLAHRILLRADRGRNRLADLLAAPEVEALDPRERGFLHELLLGALRRRGALDHALSRLANRPFARLDPEVLAALRLGAYQILFLRVPDRAAVSESVELLHGAKTRGFVNAVLRRLAVEGPPPEPDPGSDPLGWLTTAGSLPRWLGERWVARMGAARAVARAKAFLQTPASTFRLNPRRADSRSRVEAAGLEARPLPVPGAWEATAGRPADLAALGVLYLQDQGSQAVAQLATGGATVLDACAAPGGKALLLADEPSRPLVVAAEASGRRLGTLALVCRRWGAGNVRLVGADSRRPPFRPFFDTVLLDAPCSGLGTIGRHPDIRWKLKPADLPRHAQRQRELLEALAPLVKPAGRLVYAVCSVEPEENEGVLGPFLEAHPEFAIAPLPDLALPFADGAYLRTVPERDQADAFFAALLQKP